VARHEVRPFRLGLLHAVLAEHALAGGDHRLDRLGAEGLGDRDQGDRGRIAPRIAAGRVDLSADGGEPFSGADRSGCKISQGGLRI
jgi:hypothetical protein